MVLIEWKEWLKSNHLIAFRDKGLNRSHKTSICTMAYKYFLLVVYSSTDFIPINFRHFLQELWMANRITILVEATINRLFHMIN